MDDNIGCLPHAFRSTCSAAPERCCGVWAVQSKDAGAIFIDNGENIELWGPFAVCNTRESWTYGQATLVSFNEEKLEWIVNVRPRSLCMLPRYFTFLI